MPSIRLLPTSTLRLLRAQSTAVHSSTVRHYSSAFKHQPSPPRLPAEQQAEFERLQRAVADRFADPTPLPHEQPQLSPTSTSRHVSTPDTAAKAGSTTDDVTTGGVWRGAPPEFEGDKNPKTGEVGGPKTEPLRWGSKGDWSFNGRVTDF